MSKILDVKELNVSFNVNKNNIEAVRNSTFTISKGKTLAIVGGEWFRKICNCTLNS